MDVRLITAGIRIGTLVRNGLIASAQDNKVRIHLRETEYKDYQPAKCDLVIVAYDLTKEKALTSKAMYELVLMLECADIDAPEVQLAVCKGDVPKEVFEDWVDKLTLVYPIVPFDVEEERSVIDTALQREILLCV